jgi:hypothetical protein
MHGRGLGGLLLTALTVAARERGITKFHLEVLRANMAMAALLHELDDHARPVSVDGGVAVYDLPLSDVRCDESVSGALLRILKMAAGGLEVSPPRLCANR